MPKVSRKRWSSESDQKLIEIAQSLEAGQRHKAGTVPALEASFPGRTLDSIRNRLHHLRNCGHHMRGPQPDHHAPDLHAPALPDLATPAITGWIGWTPEEDELILREISSNGFKWRRIASKLPRRSESSIRNRYNRLLVTDRQGSSSSTTCANATSATLLPAEIRSSAVLLAAPVVMDAPPLSGHPAPSDGSHPPPVTETPRSRCGGILQLSLRRLYPLASPRPLPPPSPPPPYPPTPPSPPGDLALDRVACHQLDHSAVRGD